MSIIKEDANRWRFLQATMIDGSLERKFMLDYFQTPEYLSINADDPLAFQTMMDKGIAEVWGPKSQKCAPVDGLICVGRHQTSVTLLFVTERQAEGFRTDMVKATGIPS